MNGVKDVELVPAQSQEVSPFERLAKDPAVDVDKLERLMQMHERITMRDAEQKFNAAMTQAQAAMRPISADATNPETHSKYASYEALDRALRPIYTQHGFGVSFDTADAPVVDFVRVLAYVTHSGGFARTYRVDMPADGKGPKGGAVMSRTHASGAAMSYGMRYLQKMIWNVAVGEDDRDGNAVKAAPTVPAGFEDWLIDLQSTADTGFEPLSKAWKASKEEFRAYLKAVDPGEVERLKAKARAVKS